MAVTPDLEPNGEWPVTNEIPLERNIFFVLMGLSPRVLT